MWEKIQAIRFPLLFKAPTGSGKTEAVVAPFLLQFNKANYYEARDTLIDLYECFCMQHKRNESSQKIFKMVIKNDYHFWNIGLQSIRGRLDFMAFRIFTYAVTCTYTVFIR